MNKSQRTDTLLLGSPGNGTAEIRTDVLRYLHHTLGRDHIAPAAPGQPPHRIASRDRRVIFALGATADARDRHLFHCLLPLDRLYR